MMLIVVLLNVGIDTYIYRAMRRRGCSRWLCALQAITAMLFTAGIIVTVCLPRRDGDEGMLLAIMWLLFAYFSIYIPKFLFVLLDLIASIPKLWRHRRMRWLSWTGGIVGGALFVAMWWGALINRERMQIREVTVEIPGLPTAFEGYRILQFSDIHVGTYGTDTRFMAEMVERINSLHPDLIAFTGDIVNRTTEELVPFVETLSGLKAPDGVVSILGNHDYGDYYDWPSEAHKAQNMTDLYNLQERMGWRLLLNETEWLHRGNDSLAVIGVENVGDPPFPTYGSLEGAYATLDDSQPKILLSHNPAHWVNDIASNDSINIALTLSGHTHAMQIEVAGLSPAVWRYPTWGGLYSDSDHRHELYVNIGVGTVGIPMRLGATPELTIITLQRAPQSATAAKVYRGEK